MKIITITGYKGGVGKSTTAIHLATYFSTLGKTILVDVDPNRTAMAWGDRGKLPFDLADERQAMKMIGSSNYVVIDTPARPHSDDLQELAKGCDLLVLPTAPDVLSLQPMLETAQDLGDAHYRALLTIVPPYPNREGEQMRSELKEAGIPIFETLIRRTVGYQKAALAGVPICDLPDKRFQEAWQDYLDLGQEIQEVLT